MSDDFWDKAFNDDTFGSLKPYKMLGEDSPDALPLLIDGDIIAYRAAAPCDGRGYAIINKETQLEVASERYKKEIMKVYLEEYDTGEYEVVPTKNPEPESYAIYNIDKIMQPLIEKYPGAWVRTFLTGKTNFRNQIFDEYKGNRKNSERPVHLNACKDYLIKRYGAVKQMFMEADDLMGIEAMKLWPDREFRIITIDKDLNCIPGGHFNFVKGDEYDVTEEEAMLCFYTQCLTGDTVDNIPGIKGIGPKKAAKILDGAEDAVDCYVRVLEAWAKSMPQYIPAKVVATMNMSAELLWILQEEGVMWTPPVDEAIAIKAIEEDRDAVA